MNKTSEHSTKLSSEGLTTGQDLKLLLSKCKKCFDAVANGQNIISFDKLHSINISELKNNQTALIINSAPEIPSESPKHQKIPQIGHWFNLFIKKNKKAIYMIDGLDYIRTQTKIMNRLKQFCDSNGFSFINLKIRTQKKNSSFCGYFKLILYFPVSFINSEYIQNFTV